MSIRCTATRAPGGQEHGSAAPTGGRVGGEMGRQGGLEGARRFGRVLLVSALGWGTACASAGRSSAWEKPGWEGESVRGEAEAGAETERGAPVDVERALEEAEEHWAARDDRAALLRAIELWEAVLRADGRNLRALTRLARAHYFFVEAHLAEESRAAKSRSRDEELERIEHYRRGADAGELALVILEPDFARTMRESGDFVEAVGYLRPDAVEAAYWYFANLGSFALAKGLSEKLFYKDRVAAGLDRLRELDAPFHWGAPDRSLGVLYAALPNYAGKDLDRSQQHFHAAAALGPGYLRTYVLEAELVAVQLGERERYVELLQAVLAAPVGDDPDMVPENRMAQRAAQRLLSVAEVEARF